jgi:hypothetical protein
MGYSFREGEREALLGVGERERERERERQRGEALLRVFINYRGLLQLTSTCTIGLYICGHIAAPRPLIFKISPKLGSTFHDNFPVICPPVTFSSNLR